MSRRAAQALILTAAGLVLGLLVSLQLKNVIAAGGSVSLIRIRELNERIDALEQDNAALEREIAALHSEALERERAAHAASEQTDALMGALEALRAEAGLTPLSGPGVTVTVRQRTAAGGDTLQYVSDTDLLYIVNELWAAGAEAIAINDQRLGASSEIRRAGAYISINGYATAAPFTITALGDGKALSSALSLYGGVVDMLSDAYDIEIIRQGSLTVPALKDATGFRYAQPLDGSPS
ncbi:MAG: DUF881 domain-containing protein [Christensenellales bacterium]|jgi:uncharacterized protein YlxW (UPF0749 family)